MVEAILKQKQNRQPQTIPIQRFTKKV